MVNPGISRDGKYPKNLENWEILGNKNSYKKIYYISFGFFFFKKNIFKLYMLYYVTAPFKICYQMNCIGTLYKMKMKAASLYCMGKILITVM